MNQFINAFRLATQTNVGSIANLAAQLATGLSGQTFAGVGLDVLVTYGNQYGPALFGGVALRAGLPISVTFNSVDLGLGHSSAPRGA
jgi:hypothetical protein